MRSAPLRERLAWCLNDVANSAFALVVLTAFYALHFRGKVVGDGDADALWGLGISVSMLLVAVSSPMMGALADRRGWRKRLLLVYTAAGVAATFAMGYVGPGMVAAGLLLLVAGNAAFEGSLVFYDSLLPGLADSSTLGRWSGYGWAAGYLGSIACLLVAKELYEGGGFAPVSLLVGAWWLAFSLPLFLLVRERVPPEGLPPEGVFRLLARTFRRVLQRPHLARFFLAYFLYNDGIATTIVFAAVFAEGTLGMDAGEIAMMLLVVQIAGAAGALSLGHLADRIGHARTISISLAVWCLLVPTAYFVDEKPTFFALAAGIGLVMGATQSASRAFLASVAGDAEAGELFGFKAVAGKFSAVLGPTVFGVTSTATGSQRTALLAVGLFFLAGLALMLRVDEREARLR